MKFQKGKISENARNFEKSKTKKISQKRSGSTRWRSVLGETHAPWGKTTIGCYDNFDVIARAFPDV